MLEKVIGWLIIVFVAMCCVAFVAAILCLTFALIQIGGIVGYSLAALMILLSLYWAYKTGKPGANP